MNPKATAGNTKTKLLNAIINMIPVLLRPTILITLNSNVFDSTLIISNEYTRRILSIMKRMITMLKINPKNNMRYCS